MSVTIDVAEAFFPGAELEGVVRWELDAAPARAALRLLWETSGAGVTDRQVVEVVDLAALPAATPTAPGGSDPYRGVQVVDALAPGPLKASDARRFRLRAPSAPPSFNGTLIRLSWALEVEVDSSRAVRPITLSPVGTAIRLPR